MRFLSRLRRDLKDKAFVGFAVGGGLGFRVYATHTHHTTKIKNLK